MATPQDIDALMQHAVAAHQAGRLDEAAAVYRDVLARWPGFPDALHLIGLVHFQRGDLPSAEAGIRQALHGRPDAPMFWFNLGNVLRQAGQVEPALEAFGRAASLEPGMVGALVNRANLLKEVERFAEAAADYDHVLTLFPNDDRALDGAGSCCRKMGQGERAERFFRRAVAANPAATVSWINLARLLADGSGGDEALSIAQGLVGRGGLQPEQWREVGSVFARLERLDDAIACFDACLGKCPEDDRARVSRADMLMRSWRHEEAWNDYSRLLEHRPDDAACWQAVITRQLYYGRVGAEDLCALHRRYETLLPPGQAGSVAPGRESGRGKNSRVRVGFISPDFRRHPCAQFLWPLVKEIDASRFELFFYAEVDRPDDVTERFRTRAEHWRDLRFQPAREKADRVRKDKLDILVDLAGHTDGGAMAILAWRLAPIQATWLGYPASTGLSSMDFRLTDAVADPPGIADAHCVEALLRLPDGFLSFSMFDDPVVAPKRPGPERKDPVRSVVFGSYNNLFKVTPEVLALWADIVLAVPGGRLVLKSGYLGNAGTRARVAAFLAGRGLDASRVELHGALPPREHLESYRGIDIALDPFPYNGTTTTCEALCMGVPVVTLCGSAHVSRVGASLLTVLGCPELIASDLASYKRIAVGLAEDRERRRDLRAALPARFRASPLCDGPAFARKFEQALDEMLRRKNHSQPL